MRLARLTSLLAVSCLLALLPLDGGRNSSGRSIVGMDEVFLIGNAASPSTKGKDAAEASAKAVNQHRRRRTGARHPHA